MSMFEMQALDQECVHLFQECQQRIQHEGLSQCCGMHEWASKVWSAWTYFGNVNMCGQLQAFNNTVCLCNRHHEVSTVRSMYYRAAQ